MIDYKKTYYYVVCLIAFFVLLWGTIDFGSASSSFLLNKNFVAAEAQESQPLDEYYQKKMTRERLSDSLIRILISGGVFVYCRKKISQLEGGE